MKKRREVKRASRPTASSESRPDTAATPRVVEEAARDAATGWPAFIEAYSDFILGCIGRVATCPDERMEIYVHVCARLRADGCRRLGQFRGRSDSGPCQFTTWLATVTLNLSKEWIRVSKGRRRMFRALRRLSLLDQLVFRYHHWENFPAEQIAPMLACNHGMEVSPAEVDEAFGRIRDALSSNNRWRLISAHNRQSGAESLDEPYAAGGRARAWIPHKGPGPEKIVARERAGDLLEEAISTLKPLERRALRLRFSEGRTAKQTAEELGVDNYKRIYEIQARALVKIRRELEGRGVRLADFGEGVDVAELLK